jgi:hypothetical protein
VQQPSEGTAAVQLADILTNPVTQRLSQSKFCIAVALVATTFALVWEVVHGRATGMAVWPLSGRMGNPCPGQQAGSHCP